MRTACKTVFFLSELSDSARERALETMRGWSDIYGWSDESLQSIRAFCDSFGVRLTEYSIGPWLQIEYKTDATNANFRGVKLRDINRDEMPTGYCLDCTLWQGFFDEFKRTGDSLHAFGVALDAAFNEWRNDWEDAYSDESLAELAEINEYEFYENGERV